MKFYKGEIVNLLLSILLLGILFSIFDVARAPDLSTAFGHFIIITIFVGISYISHELAHKFVAQKHGCTSIYVIDMRAMLLSIVVTFLSLGNIIFAAPGYVRISKESKIGKRFSELTAEEVGRIALAGPLANFT